MPLIVISLFSYKYSRHFGSLPLLASFFLIIMFMKDWACFLFLDPQDEVGPSISSSVVLCSFVLLVYIVALVLVFYLCPSSVRVVATYPLLSLKTKLVPLLSLKFKIPLPVTVLQSMLLLRHHLNFDVFK